MPTDDTDLISFIESFRSYQFSKIGAVFLPFPARSGGTWAGPYSRQGVPIIPPLPYSATLEDEEPDYPD